MFFLWIACIVSLTLSALVGFNDQMSVPAGAEHSSALNASYFGCVCHVCATFLLAYHIISQYFINAPSIGYIMTPSATNPQSSTSEDEMSGKELLSVEEQKFHTVFVALTAYLVLGTMVFQHIEDFSPRKAMFFCLSTVTTVGYGDYYPHTVQGRILVMVYACA